MAVWGGSSWPSGLWWLAGHQSVCVPFLCCVCLVVKSTLATVRLSISPVWQSWKEPLFGGQSHPTLITGAARESWRGGMDLGGGGEVNGGTADGGGGGMESLHTWATCCHLPFSAWLPSPFYLLGFFGLQPDTLTCVLETQLRHTGTPWPPWHRLLRQHLSVPNCSLSLSLLFILFLPHCSQPSVISPSVSPWLCCNNKHSIQLSWCMTWVGFFACCRAKVRQSRWGGSEGVRVPGDTTSTWQMEAWLQYFHTRLRTLQVPQRCVNVLIFERPQSKVYSGCTWKSWMNNLPLYKSTCFSLPSHQWMSLKKKPRNETYLVLYLDRVENQP